MIGGKKDDCFCTECRSKKNKDDMRIIKVGGKTKEVCRGCEYRFAMAAKRGTHV